MTSHPASAATDPQAVQALLTLTRLLKVYTDPLPGDPDYVTPAWVTAMFNGEAPVHGACRWCGCHLAPSGCLNLCDMPTGTSRNFIAVMQEHLAERRARARWADRLAGCRCDEYEQERGIRPTDPFGYGIERPGGHPAWDCPVSEANKARRAAQEAGTS